MKKLMKPLAAAALALTALVGSPANAAWTCKVTDPTGTPLNVRSEPNSGAKVIGTLKNGLEVIIGEVTEDGRWAEVIPVVKGRKPKFDGDGLPVFDGWVFMKYLDNGKCLPADYPLSK
jgi:Bacterial SH3 domain